MMEHIEREAKEAMRTLIIAPFLHTLPLVSRHFLEDTERDEIPCCNTASSNAVRT